MRFGVCLKCCVACFLLVCPTLCAGAQGFVLPCEEYMRFQIRLDPNAHQQKRLPSIESLRATAGLELLSIVSVLPFDVRSEKSNTVSLLLIVWDGGLREARVDKFAASLHREERLHLRLAILTRHSGESLWTDDPREQRKLLDGAAAESSAFPADEPGRLPKNSDEVVLETRWEDQLRTSVEDTIAQPGKQVILELLPPPPLRPPQGAEHWRISADRDYPGEPQVYTFAALGVTPVYRVHNETPALAMIIPGRDASYSPPLGSSANISASTLGQEELAQLQGTAMPPALPPGSRLFANLGGKDVFEARDALALIEADLKRMYSVVTRTPKGCTPQGVVPLRMQVTPTYHSSFTLFSAPQWADFHLLQRRTADDDVR